MVHRVLDVGENPVDTAALRLGYELPEAEHEPFIVKHDEHHIQQHDKPAHGAGHKGDARGKEIPRRGDRCPEQRFPFIPGEETHHLVEIYVIADKAVDFIGDVRKLHLSGCVLPDHLGHLRALSGHIRDKEREKSSKQYASLKQGNHHRNKPLPEVKPAHVPLNQRLEHVCYQARHKKREQHSLQHIKQIKHRNERNHGEQYPDHAVECVWPAAADIIIRSHLSINKQHHKITNFFVKAVENN